MKKIIRKNINLPYSLHDSSIIHFEAKEDKLTFQFKSGIFKAVEPYSEIEGNVIFENVDWDFSYIYLLSYKDVLCGNCGNFSGEKISLLDFINKHKASSLKFDIIDETYGYNKSKFNGFISFSDTRMYECFVEIYHLGDMHYYLDE